MPLWLAIVLIFVAAAIGYVGGALLTAKKWHEMVLRHCGRDHEP
jgi:uncharacterized protein YneF (UPF0154 family)